MKKLIIICFLFVSGIVLPQSTIGNYVSNGSFELIIDCNDSFLEYKAKGWTALDSVKSVGPLYNIDCGNVPNTGVGFQTPHSGKGFIRLSFYCVGCNFSRSNLKNRLKRKLQAGKSYCAKMHLVLQDSCSIAIDKFGMYFADPSVDTINFYSRSPLTFLTPQISNSVGAFISGQQVWATVSGTFIASGSEKYLVIANFSSDVQTGTLSTGVIVSDPNPFSEYFVDDVSVIEINLPAYAGRDTTVLPGSPVFLGREPDFATDSGCVWYQWPNLTTPIDTVSGLWVNPVVTTTYIVRQVLDCSPEKWDTVVVKVDATVGLGELKARSQEARLQLFPNPADDYLELRFTSETDKEHWRMGTYSSLGELLREEEFSERISTERLPAGVYFLQLSGPEATVRKSFVIAR